MMSHGHSNLNSALAVQWEKFVQRIIKLCTIIHTASMAHTTIWMLLFIEYCLLRSTTGNVFKFVRMFKSIDHFLAKNNIVFFNLLNNPMELNPYSETHLNDQAFSHLLETWLCYFASTPNLHEGPSLDLILNKMKQSLLSHSITLKFLWTWFCIHT